MGTPNRQSIIADIKSTLEGITTGNGYQTDVDTVETVIRDWADHDIAGYPWIGIMPQLQNYTYQPGAVMRVVLRILLVAHVSSTTKALAHTSLDDLHDDIIAALETDTTRGGNAVSTTIVDHQDDTADPDTVDHDGVKGTLNMNLNVVYYRNRSLS